MNKISVIIVSWNAKDFLRNCLASIYKNSGTLIGEVIVVDNASTDGSPEMVTKEFPGVTVIRSSNNLGFACGNNLGIKQASHDYLALVNSDVIVHPGCFETLTAFLEHHEEAGLVGPKVLDREDRLQSTCRRFPTLMNTICRALALDHALQRWPLLSREMTPLSHFTESDVEVLSGCFWLARRKAVDVVGGLDERFFFYAEDVDWCKRFRDAGWRIMFIPQASATHFGGGSSDNAPLRYSIEMLRANLAFWRKHNGIPGQVAYYLLSILHHFLRLILRGLNVVIRSDPTKEARFKFTRSQVCLRWLITGKETFDRSAL
ncbi:MAG: glycosyltransferase family 2 protein [bacterium]